MARFRKTVLKADTYTSPEGDVVATPERIRHWANQDAAMRAAGIKRFPVPWGHQLNAVPHYEDEPAERLYRESRLNAGYFLGLEASPDGRSLDAVIDVPGADLDENGNLVTWAELPDGRKVKCAIGEVSAAITKQFRDGKDRVWNDIMSHIALVPMPVWSDQEGFQKLGTRQGDEKTVFLSLGTSGWRTLATSSTGAKPMADEPAKKPADDEMDDDIDVEAEADEAPEDDAEGEEGGQDAQIAEIIDQLAAVANIHLPGATNAKNFVEHLKIVLDHMQNAGAAGEQPQEEFNGTNNSPVTAEQSPVMMSLRRIVDDPNSKPEDKSQAQAALDEAKRLREFEAKQITKRQEIRRKKLADKFEKVQKAYPAEVVEKITVQPETVCLSLNRVTGKASEPKHFTLNEVLDLLLEAAKSRATPKLTQTLSTARALGNPLTRAMAMAGKHEVSKKESSEMAHRLARVPMGTNGNGKHKRHRDQDADE